MSAVDGLLRLSRTGRSARHKEDTDIAALARNVADELSGEYRAARIDIGAPPRARVDRALGEGYP
jgi:hypothetical protein